MRQYNLHDRYLDVMVSDFALNVWREQELFDVIVTDRKYRVEQEIFFPTTSNASDLFHHVSCWKSLTWSSLEKMQILFIGKTLSNSYK